MAASETLIRPSPKAFLLRNYAWAAAAVPLLLLAGLYILFGSSGPDIILPLGSLPVMQVVLGLWSLAVIIAGFALIHTHLHQRVYLALRNEELVYESGILNHHIITVPLHMITDSQVTRMWFDRVIGVSTLKVNTSGGAGYEITAVDFPAEEIARMHSELLKLVNKLPNSLSDDLARGPAKPSGGPAKK